MMDPAFVLASRCFIALVFTYALILKWPHRQEFRGVIAAYRILPAVLVGPAAYAVLVLETVVVMSLASGVALEQGAALAAAMLCLFALAMAVNLWRGRADIECGCFRDSLRQHLAWSAVARNLLFAFTALLPLANPATPPSVLQEVDGLCWALTLFILWLIATRLRAAQRSITVLRRRWSS